MQRARRERALPCPAAKQPPSRHARLRQQNLAFNLLLRSLVHLGGVITTLLIASAVAFGMARWFAWQQQRSPTARERLRLLGVYGGVLALLYLGLLGLMLLKDEPGPMGLAIFTLHYVCYPLLAWLTLARWVKR